MKFVYLLGIVVFVVSCSGSGEPISTTSTATAASSVTTTTSVGTTATSGQGTSGQSTTTAEPLPPLQALIYTEIAAGLPFPTMISARPADGALFFITKDGQVWDFADGAPQTVMDISDLVTNSGEQGLLGMAWHPTDASRLFLHYSDDSGDTTIVEYTDLDASQSRLLLSVDQPAANHNGGTIDFGPDGYLWIALGDGGGAGDTFGTGQTTDDLLAGLL
ncbi:MAG: PQQ-dependent sugar dehydrogenase, partial [Acidimicrobiia bacterium]